MQSSLWLWAITGQQRRKQGHRVKKPQELVIDEGGLIITITAMIWKRKAAHGGL